MNERRGLWATNRSTPLGIQRIGARVQSYPAARTRFEIGGHSGESPTTRKGVVLLRNATSQPVPPVPPRRVIASQ